MNDALEQLTYYTLNKGDAEFIHQHVVDAFTAQHANESTKQISLFFSLAGLYLLLEKNFTGKEVQLAHMRMAQRTKKYPEIKIPAETGKFKISEVFTAGEPHQTDKNVHKWCASVWQSYSSIHEIIRTTTEKLLAEQPNGEI